MATIRERRRNNGTKVYHVQIRLRGYPPQTASFDRKTDARHWAQDIESAIRERRYFKGRESRRRTLNDVIRRYKQTHLVGKKTRRDLERYLDWWNQQIGGHSLADITPALIVEHRDGLASGLTWHGKGRAPATVNRYLEALSKPLTVSCNEWQWLDENPMRKVSKLKQPRGRVRWLSDDERERLLSACRHGNNPYLEIVVILALSTGARYSEIMNLRWSDVDLNRGMAILDQTKNDERRALPITGLALEKLKVFSKVRRLDTELLFPRKDGDKPMTLRKHWLRALQEAQIDDFRFHDLRHCTASYLAMDGASLPEIAAVLGHKTLQMVQRYAHLSERHTAKVVESMNEKIFG